MGSSAPCSEVRSAPGKRQASRSPPAPRNSLRDPIDTPYRISECRPSAATGTCTSPHSSCWHPRRKTTTPLDEMGLGPSTVMPRLHSSRRTFGSRRSGDTVSPSSCLPLRRFWMRPHRIVDGTTVTHEVFMRRYKLLKRSFDIVKINVCNKAVDAGIDAGRLLSVDVAVRGN
jgi:hypothetical protein